MKIGGIIVLCVAVILFIIFFIAIRIFNKLTLKKIGTEIAYIGMDDLFIKRYELLEEFFGLCENPAKASEERENAINSKTAEERVEHDKKMAEALNNLLESERSLKDGRGKELCDELRDLDLQISQAYTKYNEAVAEYEAMRNKKIVKPVAKFFSFEEKPFF